MNCKTFVVVVALGLLTGCASQKPLYLLTPYTNPDGSKGMRDSYAQTTEEEANKILALTLREAGLCPYGWYIEKSSTAPDLASVTTREIKCN